jgi:hypothetical protein
MRVRHVAAPRFQPTHPPATRILVGMSSKQPADETPVRRIDRILTFMSLGVIVLSVASFFALLIADAAGLESEDFGRGAWPIIATIPMIGLPIGFLLIFALLIMSMIRRGRASDRPS